MINYMPVTLDQTKMNLMDIVGKELDFNDLNKVMADLNDSSVELSEQEKVIATDVINQWERDVIHSIEDKERDISKLIVSLDVSSSMFYIDLLNIPEIQGMIKATGLEAMFFEYMDLEDQLARLDAQKPTRYKPNINDSIEDKINFSHDYAKEYDKYTIKWQSLTTKMDEMRFNLKVSLNNNEAVKRIISQAQAYKRNVSKKIREARMISQQAKINVSISSQKAKNALAGLIDFQKRNS